MKKKFTMVLTGMPSDEYVRDSGGIQLAEISFIKNAARDCGDQYIVSTLSSKFESPMDYRDVYGVHVHEIDNAQIPRKGGMVDTWYFSSQAKSEIIKKMIEGEDLIHYASIGPAMNIIDEITLKYRELGKFTTKFIYTLHNPHYAIADEPYDIFEQYPEEWQFLHDQELRVVKTADATVVTSKRLSVELSKKWNMPIEFIPNTIGEITSYKVKDKYRVDNELVFGTMSRIAAVKNLTRTWNAMDKVLSEHPNANYLIAGSGESEDELLGLIQDSGHRLYIVEDPQNWEKEYEIHKGDYNVFFLKHLAGPAKTLFLNMIDIFVHPSFREVSPLVGLENLVFGNYIVASDIPGWQDYKDNGAYVEIVDPLSTAAIYEGINRAIDTVKKVGGAKIFEGNREVYENIYSPNIVVPTRIKFYNEILEK